MLDSIHHMTFRILLNLISGVKKTLCNVVNTYATLLWTPLRFPKIDKSLVVYRFYCMALFHSQTRRHMIKVVKSG